MKISAIFGTRPEAIKLAPVILALQGETAMRCQVCVTGQHRELLDQVLEIFNIKPYRDLSLMLPNQTLGGFTARAVQALDTYLASERPDMVLVQGDTTTVLCATLTAFYHKIPVAHVEAGLRTGNLQSPWPEEANRVLTTRLAALHFAPTEANRQNLLKEGVPDEQIIVTGNTVIDALFLALEIVRRAPPPMPSSLDFFQNSTNSTRTTRIVLITGHRRENFGSGFENICRAIAKLAQQFPNVHFIYPVHLNPNVRGPVQRILGKNDHAHRIPQSALSNVHLIEPLAYLPFVALMNRASLILTDSGGVQEEAPSLGKPVLVMRDTTERPEAIRAGTVKLVGTNIDSIVSQVSELLTNEEAYLRMSHAHNPYGDGHAATRIVKSCVAFLRGNQCPR
jgi:UDP-N-acetylglucosamine 2-epimerase (non-hydrolysing)